MTQPTRYSTLSILLHWLMAVLIVAAFSIGLSVDDMPLSPAKFKWIAYHKWIGITVLGLFAFRLLARLLGTTPPLPETMSPAAQLAAKLGHLALYVLMLAIPLTGWLMSSAYGFPVVYLKLVQLPDLVAQNKALAETLKGVHATLNWIMAATVIGHVAAALKHHVIDRDGLLWRMSLLRR
jgi:cytochrome b561